MAYERYNLPGHTRRFRACVAVAGGYAVVVVLGLLLRREVELWGFAPIRGGPYALGVALALHVALAATTGVLLAVTRKHPVRTARPARVTLALLPIMLFVSIDRLAAVGYPYPDREINRFIPHPTRLWANRPGFEGSYKGLYVRINSHGCRGPEVPYERTPGEQRLLILGDSIPFGYRVNEDDCFVWRIPELAREARLAKPVTVVNAGVQGYSPWQEYDLLKTEGLRYRPDLIVLTFCVNDVLSKYQLVPFGGRSVGHRPIEPSRLEHFGLYRMAQSMLMDYLYGSRRARARRARRFGFRRLINEPTAPDVVEGWRVTLENMAKIVALAGNHDIPIVLVVFPHTDQLILYPPDKAIPQAKLARFAEEAGVPMLDLLPLFRLALAEPGVKIDDLFVDPLHPNPRGHALVAEAIFVFLVDRGLLR